VDLSEIVQGNESRRVGGAGIRRKSSRRLVKAEKNRQKLGCIFGKKIGRHDGKGHLLAIDAPSYRGLLRKNGIDFYSSRE